MRRWFLVVAAAVGSAGCSAAPRPAEDRLQYSFALDVNAEGEEEKHLTVRPAKASTAEAPLCAFALSTRKGATSIAMKGVISRAELPALLRMCGLAAHPRLRVEDIDRIVLSAGWRGLLDRIWPF